MKQRFTTLLLFITLFSFAQKKDKRAELQIIGRINEISVAPDEKIWLVTAVGRTYYTDHIDSTWHYGKSMGNDTDDDYSVNNPNLERISFFNKDTAILTGYISKDPKEYTKNGYYRTTNGGKTWKLLDYGGNSWIYTICNDNKGNVWMGGLTQELYYSADFGKTWTTIKMKYKSSDRTYGIYMNDAENGIASSDANEILSTTDNWKSVKHLPTPLDQDKYKAEGNGYIDSRISKIIQWGNYYVVNQNGHLFYSETGTIDWKSFPNKIYDFEVDKENNQLYGINDSLKVVCYANPTDYKVITNKALSSFPIDMKIVNHSLFLLSSGYQVSKLTEGKLTQTQLYSTEKPIADPYLIRAGNNLTWGINGDQVYLSEGKKTDWYREQSLEFGVADFSLLNDSTAILWDGKQNNYKYSLRDHKAILYYPKNPIQSFLKAPLTTITINSGSRGCFHSFNNEVHYEKSDDSTFVTKESKKNENWDSKESKFKNKVNANLIASILKTIDAQPTAIPSLKDFQITEKDKKNYLDLVDKLLKNKDDDGDRRKKINKEFYSAVPKMLDTLKGDIISNILNQQERSWSTTSNWFTVQLSNQDHDTINITRNYYINTLPWNLPWKIEYKGLNFNCYDIEFSKYINSCIPDDFMDKEVFDNSRLILSIADYLYNKKE